jgi:adenine-specific DNA-methyltransferase
MAKKNASNKVESIRHKDKRKNIPAEELRDFVAEDENAPKTMRYPRDPSTSTRPTASSSAPTGR